MKYIILILICLFLIFITGCNNKIIPTEANEYCVVHNFTQATDVNDYYYTGFADRFIYVKQIECDNRQIFQVNYDVICIERDKWNTCIKEKLVYK
jgi:hypothetical protein